MKYLFIIILGIILLVGGIILLTPLGEKVADVSYSGQEIFYNEEDYISFKQDIIKYEVKIDKLNTLSSSPPIIVEFDVSLKDNDMIFPYGERYSNNWAFGFAVVMIGFMILAIRQVVRKE